MFVFYVSYIFFFAWCASCTVIVICTFFVNYFHGFWGVYFWYAASCEMSVEQERAAGHQGQGKKDFIIF